MREYTNKFPSDVIKATLLFDKEAAVDIPPSSPK